MKRIRQHLTSYVYAVRGIVFAFRYENNMRVHLTAAIAVVVVNSVLCRLSKRLAWIPTNLSGTLKLTNKVLLTDFPG